LNTSTLEHFVGIWLQLGLAFETKAMSGKLMLIDYPTIAAKRKVKTGMAGWKAAA
jgi:hypothetical protein